MCIPALSTYLLTYLHGDLEADATQYWADARRLIAAARTVHRPACPACPACPRSKEEVIKAGAGNVHSYSIVTSRLAYKVRHIGLGNASSVNPPVYRSTSPGLHRPLVSVSCHGVHPCAATYAALVSAAPCHPVTPSPNSPRSLRLCSTLMCPYSQPPWPFSDSLTSTSPPSEPCCCFFHCFSSIYTMFTRGTDIVVPLTASHTISLSLHEKPR